MNREDSSLSKNSQNTDNTIQSNNTELSCSVCFAGFTTVSNKRRHVKRRHPEQAQIDAAALTAFQCVVCTESFKSSELLGKHLFNCSGLIRERSTSLSRQRSDASSIISTRPSIDLTSSQEYNFASLTGSSTAVIPFSSSSAAADISASVRIMDDSTMALLFDDFIKYLSSAPVTPLQQTITQKRVVTPEQKTLVRNNLRHLCNILLQCRAIQQPSDMKLALFCQPTTISVIHNHLTRNLVKQERIYQLFLLLKKLVVYLINKQSELTGRYLLPSSIPSWTIIDAICHESCSLRKQQALDRLSGINNNRHVSSAASTCSAHSAPVTQQTHSSTSSSSTITSSATQPAMNSSSNADILSKEELSLLAQTCLDRMKAMMGEVLTKSNALSFAQYLCVSILILHATPRSQTLKQLVIRINHILPPAITPPPVTLFREAAHYEIKISSANSKDRKPIVLQINQLLTAILDYYISNVRQLLMPPTVHDLGYLFFTRTGSAKDSYVDYVKNVCLEVIGRVVTPHSFRASTVCLFYSSNTDGNAEKTMEVLSKLMNHSRATQNTHYFKIQRQEESQKVNDQITSMLGISSNTVSNTDISSTAAATESAVAPERSNVGELLSTSDFTFMPIPTLPTQQDSLTEDEFANIWSKEL